MRASNFREVHRFKGIFRLCLWLVVIGLVIAGSLGCGARGGQPQIKVFSADPLELNDGDFALYSFEVKGATKIQIIEAGETIEDINGPASATHKGTVKGVTTYAMRTGGSNTFETVLIATNSSGEQTKTLTLSFATVLPPSTSLIPPISTSQTENRTPQWKEQYSSSLPTQPTSTTTRDEPDFFKCPSNCKYCLKPDEAAAQGFTTKCSEQPCYYSPDNQQKWYCYSEPEGWCCVDGKVGQASQAQCVQMGGYWYATQAEAVQRCQPMCWCCVDGKVGQTTQTQCVQMGGACYSTQAEATKACQQMCWCCVDGKVGQTTQTQCVQMGGACYSTQAEATRACQQTTTCWCCANGKVFQTTQTQCAQVGGACYSTQAEATRACQQTATCWCCAGGKVFQTTQTQCSQAGGTCYSTQAEATKACQYYLK